MFFNFFRLRNLGAENSPYRDDPFANGITRREVAEPYRGPSRRDHEELSGIGADSHFIDILVIRILGTRKE